MDIKGNGKALIFSDIHFGKSRDSHMKLEQCCGVIDWICSQAKKNNISTIIFLGDFFNNRSHLNILTLTRAYESLKKLCSTATVYFIVGNHDLYMKSGTDIHSLAAFEHLDNFFYIDKPTIVNLPCNKTGIMAPWHWRPSDHASEEYDYLFGHLEPTGVLQDGLEPSAGSYSMHDLLNIAPRVFSGHYHNRRDYEFNNGVVHMVGCPLQLDWGDYGNSKGCHILDFKTDEVKFIKNDISPLYVKYHWSKLLDGSQKIDDVCFGSIVKLVIDCEYSYADVTKSLEEMKSFSPKFIDSPDFIFSASKNMLAGLKFEDKLEDLSLTKFTYLEQFIMKMNLPLELDKTEVVAMLKAYYDKCEMDERVVTEE